MRRLAHDQLASFLDCVVVLRDEDAALNPQALVLLHEKVARLVAAKLLDTQRRANKLNTCASKNVKAVKDKVLHARLLNDCLGGACMHCAVEVVHNEHTLHVPEAVVFQVVRARATNVVVSVAASSLHRARVLRARVHQHGDAAAGTRAGAGRGTAASVHVTGASELGRTDKDAATSTRAIAGVLASNGDEAGVAELAAADNVNEATAVHAVTSASHGVRAGVIARGTAAAGAATEPAVTRARTSRCRAGAKAGTKALRRQVNDRLGLRDEHGSAGVDAVSRQLGAKAQSKLCKGQHNWVDAVPAKVDFGMLAKVHAAKHKLVCVAR